MITEEMHRRAEFLGVTLHLGRSELVEELQPLWLSLFDHHLVVHAAGDLPVIDRSQSWPRRRALYEELLQQPETFIVVARRESTTVGYVLSHLHNGPDDTWSTGDRIAEVESIAVLPSEQGQGLGTLMLDWAEKILEGIGVMDVMIGVLVGNDDALRFYEKRGMVPAVLKLLRIGPKPA